MKKIISALLVCISVALAAAEPRIAVVNVERVFKEYYKSRIAEDFINGQMEAARLYMGQLTTQLESLRAEARKLSTNALNSALSEEARRQAADAADKALADVKAKETEITLFQNERIRELRRIDQEKRKEILEDIDREIRRRAQLENYQFVFDCSGRSANNMPVVLIYPRTNDISDAVIRELNRSAAKPTTEKK